MLIYSVLATAHLLVFSLLYISETFTRIRWQVYDCIRYIPPYTLVRLGVLTLTGITFTCEGTGTFLIGKHRIHFGKFLILQAPHGFGSLESCHRPHLMWFRRNNTAVRCFIIHLRLLS